MNQVERFRARERLKDLLTEFPRSYRVIEKRLCDYKRDFTEDKFYESYRLMIERELREDLTRRNEQL